MQNQLVAKRVFINPVFKDKLTVLKARRDAGGDYLLGELEIAPGGGNFMHTHRAFTETFTALKGELGVKLSGKQYFLQPGESITMPLHSPHHFFNPGKLPITCQVKFVPAHDGFIKGLAIAYGLAADGKTNSKGLPKSFTHLALLIILTDTKPTGILGLLFPFFKLLAKRAKKNGMEKALLEKYYYEQGLHEINKISSPLSGSLMAK